MAKTRLQNLDKLVTAIHDKIKLTDTIDWLLTADINGQVLSDTKVDWRRSSGGEWKMVCPFHNDHEPSLDVNDSKGVWLCRSAGCTTENSKGETVQRGGNAITFIRELHGLTYIESITVLAQYANIDLAPYIMKPSAKEIEQEQARDSLRALVQKLPLLEEWPGKHITAEVLEFFDVRHAPGMLSVNSSGLFWEKQAEDDWVMIPLIDDHGEYVGWTTRRMSTSKSSKNNPNSWAGARHDVIFGLFQCRRTLKAFRHRIVMVEGQTDVLGMFSNGIRNAVALRGANFQDEQHRILTHWNVREVTVCLDGDKAGKTATNRICEQYWNSGFILTVAQLPSGSDPGSMLDAGEGLALKLALTKSSDKQNKRLIDAAEYLLNRMCQDYDVSTLTGRRAFIDQALIELKMSHSQGYLRKLIVAWLSEAFNMPTLEIADIFLEEHTEFSTVGAEQAVIARAMRDVQWFSHTQTRIKAENFLLLRHQALWTMLVHADNTGVDISDLVELTDFAERHGYAKDIVDSVFLSMILERYTDSDYPLGVLVDGVYRRELVDGAKALSQQLSNANKDAKQATSEFTAKAVHMTFWHAGLTSVVTKEEQVRTTMEQLVERRNNPNEIIGNDLGACFPKLNVALRGMQKGRLHVVAAAQSVGKTTFLNNLAAQFCIHNNVPGLLIGLEMDYTEYHHRMFAQMTGLDASRIDSSRLNDDETKQVARAAAKLEASPLWFETPDSLTVDELIMLVRSYKLAHNIEVVFFDYCQLIAANRDQMRMNRYERMGDLARTMKMDIARSMDVAFITAAQLNREGAKEKRPTGENIGDSYQIAQTADTFLILAESEGNATIVDLYIDKNRQGHKDILIPLSFDRSRQIMRESESGAKNPPYLIR